MENVCEGSFGHLVVVDYGGFVFSESLFQVSNNGCVFLLNIEIFLK